MANEYRVTQVAVEVLHGGDSKARVTQMAVEVLRSVATAATAGRRRQMLN